MKLERGDFSLGKTLNQREIIMLVAVILLAIFGYYRLYFSPKNKELKDVQRNLTHQLAEKERLERQIKLKTLNVKIFESPKERQWLANKKSIEPSIQAMVYPVHIPVRISDFKSDDSRDKKNNSKNKANSLKKRSVNITVLGKIESLGNYIEYIENLEAPLVVEGISLAPNGNQVGELILRIEGGFYVAP